jgi:hypothetical protein
VNRADDVRKIQEALNRVPPDKGGPVPPLVVDGLCGPKTTAAIWKFQKAQGLPADGRIDPGHATLAKLNTVLGAARPPASPQRAKVIGHLARVGSCIRTARKYIDTVKRFLPETRPPGGSPAGGDPLEGSTALLEKHFLISQQASPRGTAEQIESIYQRMCQCFERPGGLWGPAIFDDWPFPDVKGSRAVGSAYPGGYAQAGKLDGSLRQDTIYLRKRLDLLPSDQVVITIIHELAHFVGPTVLGRIDDYSNGWVDGARMRTLQAAWRPYNAECYANLAFDAEYHRPPVQTPVP